MGSLYGVAHTRGSMGTGDEDMCALNRRQLGQRRADDCRFRNFEATQHVAVDLHVQNGAFSG